ncbi:MAG: hypothetical protein U0228_03150 [Myxococcaceae bacterium]
MRAPLLAGVLLLTTACATTHARRIGERLPDDPHWPRAGGRTVRFVGELKTPEDLGIERTVWARLWAFLSGEPEASALSRPAAVAVSPQGRVAVADPGNRAVRLYDPARQAHVRITGLEWPSAVAFAGETLVVADAQAKTVRGYDGDGASVKLPFAVPAFQRPVGLAWDEAGQRLFVVDAPAHQVVVLGGAAPRVLGGRGDEAGHFNFPTFVAWASGRLYVADSLNSRVQVFDRALSFEREFGGAGDTPGDLPRPRGLAVGPDGTVWVVEGAFDAVQGFSPEGELVALIGGAGTAAGRFWLPAGAAIDSQGRLYVADTWNARVQVFALDEEGRR